MNTGTTLIAFLLAAVGVLSPHVAPAQTTPEAGSPRVGFRLLHSFKFGGPEGSDPWGGLVQASDSNFYGVTYSGTGDDKGTVFRLRPGGGVVTVHKFSGPDGDVPLARLIQARDGNLYGSTRSGGAFDGGTVFRIAPDGQLATLFSFPQQGPLGRGPESALVEASDGNLYGSTVFGGPDNLGAVFRMSLDGAVTNVHTFGPGEPGFCSPLIQAADGNLYGTSYYGGTSNAGTVFRMTLDGTLTILKSFGGIEVDAFYPDGGLLEGMDGKLYGTATRGAGAGGIAFAITTGGEFTLVHTFLKNGKAGYWPSGELVQDADGNLYGSTEHGGAFGAGAVFRMTLDGKVADLRVFEYGRDGGSDKRLVRSVDGRLYGMAHAGGALSGGTLFALGQKPARAPALQSPGQ